MLLCLGLGSNIGQRELFLAQAFELLQQSTVLNMRDMRQSSIIETPALLPDGAPEAWNIPFLNNVIVGECALSPHIILAEIKAIEKKMGRQDRGRWGPREIDIDIIAYGDTVLHDDTLHIPHQGMLARAFVMLPLAEIAPDWVYPDTVNIEAYGHTAEQLAQKHNI